MAVVDELKTVATWDGRQLDQGLKSAAAHLSRFGTISNAAGIASVGLAAFLVRAANAAGEEAAAFARASNSFQAHGNAFPVSEMQSFASQMQQLTGVADDQIAGFLGLLGTFNLTKQQAEQLTPAILDAAEALKAQGVSSEGLAVALGKALQGGQVQGLRRMGIFVDEARFKTDRFGAVLDAVAKQGNGAAALFRQSLPGSLQAMNNAIGDAQEALGKGLIVPLTTVANFVEKAATAFANLPEPIQQGVTVITTLAVPALAALSVALKIAELRYLKTAAAAAKQGAASTAAAAQTTSAAGKLAFNVGSAIGLALRAGVFGAIAAGAGFVAQETLKAAGAKQETLDKDNPTEFGRRAGEWVRREIFGINDAQKAPEKTPEEQMLEHLRKIEENTAATAAGVAGKIGNREAEQALGHGRIARALADTIGGRA